MNLARYLTAPSQYEYNLCKLRCIIFEAGIKHSNPQSIMVGSEVIETPRARLKAEFLPLELRTHNIYN